MLKKNQCTWLLKESRIVDGLFQPAHYCAKPKNARAKSVDYPDEETQYESFCPEHMAKWTQIRKEKAARNEDEDDFCV